MQKYSRIKFNINNFETRIINVERRVNIIKRVIIFQLIL